MGPIYLDLAYPFISFSAPMISRFSSTFSLSSISHALTPCFPIQPQIVVKLHHSYLPVLDLVKEDDNNYCNLFYIRDPPRTTPWSLSNSQHPFLLLLSDLTTRFGEKRDEKKSSRFPNYNNVINE